MKILVCGDLHCKVHILEDAMEKFEEGDFDKVVFLGDYVDDWDALSGDSLYILERLVDYKEQYKDKMICRRCLKEIQEL